MVFALAFSAGCGSTGGGSDAGDGQDAGKGDAGSLPCDVQALLAASCNECHTTPTVGGAPFPLLSHADVKAASTRALLRMQAGTMPPAPRPVVPAYAIAQFAAWIDAGFPTTGACTPAPDAGSPDGGADAGVPTTCASGVFYNQLTEPPGELMNPGMSCPTCHAANALAYVAFQYAGTVMVAPHEKNACKPPASFDGGTVEVLFLDGGLFWKWDVNASGSFKTLDAGPSPYVARLSKNGQSKSSQTPHTSGDCNTCHSEQGSNGASGRLTFP